MSLGQNAFVIERKYDTFNSGTTYRRWTIGMDENTNANATPFPQYQDHLHITYTTGSEYNRALWITRGAVGIFTTDYPAYALDVNGSIHTNSNYVLTGNNIYGYGTYLNLEAPYLRFRTGTSSVNDVMRITSTGYVGIGTTSPELPLEVHSYDTHYNTNTSFGQVFYFDQDGGYALENSNSIYTIRNIAVNANFGMLSEYSIWCQRGGFYTTSDERIKTNFVDISDNESLEVLRMIKPKKYNYKAYLERGFNQVYGYIAQQIKEVLPYAVTIKKNQFIPNIYQLADVSYGLVTIYDGEDGKPSHETK